MFGSDKKPEPEKQLEALSERQLTLNAAMNDIERRIAVMLDTLADAAPRLERFEEIAAGISQRMALTNDAQASRYLELKRRLDKYDKTFEQLGILIKAVPVVLTAAPVPAEAAPPDSAPPK